MNLQPPALRNSARKNLLVTAVNVALSRGLITLDGTPFENVTFEFELAGLPVLACVCDAGCNELSIHTIVCPTELGKQWACVTIVHQRAMFGAAVAVGWLDRKTGRFLKVTGDYHASNAITPVLAGLMVMRRRT
jgi:hypothetical protein